MKKTIKIVFILLMIFLFTVSCQKAPAMDEPDKVEGLVPFSTSFYSEQAFHDFVATADLPCSFIPYEQISSLGSFYSFVDLSSYADSAFSKYVYHLVDDNHFELLLYITHTDAVAPETQASTATATSKLLSVDRGSTDLRYHSSNAAGKVVSEMYQLNYINGGKLLSIQWEVGDVEYKLCGNGASLSKYPTDGAQTLVSQLLDPSTTTAALALLAVEAAPPIDDPVDETSGDHPLLTMSDKDAYAKFVATTDLPTDFVTYEQLTMLGSFFSLVILSDGRYGDFSEYVYTFIDENNFKTVLYVEHINQLSAQDQLTAKTYLLADETTSNLRNHSSLESGYVLLDSGEYKYINGNLLSIEVPIGNIVFTVYGENLYQYPTGDKQTFVSQLLDPNTAAAALKSFAADTTQK